MASIVNMSSQEVIREGLENLPPNESATPETDQYVEQGDIYCEDYFMNFENMNFQGRELEDFLKLSPAIGVNNLLPNANNPDPNMIRAERNVVDSIPDVSHDSLKNSLNDSMPPTTNHIYREEEISSEDHSRENHVTPSAGIGVNNLMPSASNSDPNMIHASMMNSANMLLTQHGVTPATNSMNFQEGGFSVGNLESHMMSIASRSIPKDSNEEIGDLRQYGGFTYTRDTNFQETSTRAGNHDTLIHASMMKTANMQLAQLEGAATNSMNFQEGGFSVGNLESRMMMSIGNRSILKDSNEEIGDLRQHEGFTYNGDTNFQEKTSNMQLTQHDGVTPAPNSMNFQGGGFSVGNLKPRMMAHEFDEYVTSSHEAISEGQWNYSNQESEGLLNRNQMNDSSAGIGVNNSMSSASNPVPKMTHASMMNTDSMQLAQPEGVTPATDSMNFQGGGFSVGNLKPRRMVCAKMSSASTSSHEGISEGRGLRSRGIKRSLEAREKGTGEQSNFQQPLEPKNKKLTLEQLGQKDGNQISKILTDRLNRQIELDKETDLKSVLVDSWPMKEDVKEIKEKYTVITKNYVLKAPVAKQRLLGEAKNLEIVQKAREDSGNPPISMDYIVNNFDLFFSGDFIEKVKKKFSPNLGYGRSARFSHLPSAFNNLKNQVYVRGNKQVEPEDFQGLSEELKKLRWGEIPSYLQPIASQIVKDFAKVEFGHTTALVLFCAAVKEMEDFPAEKLDLDTLKKWGATLEKAKEVGFQVGFADNLLRNNLLAYFATQILGGD
ncbi:hypothetical protein J1N35_024212 [Gossypium stocksii]|uniref:Uncharacterized protein n=1 Tax=Gossypium stocksii TaxID=47602 RepID=A0A9D3VKN0_9ROSI|nr:hypothetical protein J1N35_024212 [Gossypium stocksii]